MALNWAITEKYHDYLYGANFEVVTDNNPLKYVFSAARLEPQDSVGLQSSVITTAPFLVSDCRFGISPVNYPDPDPELQKWQKERRCGRPFKKKRLSFQKY